MVDQGGKTLDPRAATLRRDQGRLVLTIGEERHEGIKVVRAFPNSAPDEWITFLDVEDEEIGTLPSLAGTDEVTETVIGEELERRYFVPRVLSIDSVRNEHRMIRWEVETDRGSRTYWVRSSRRSEGARSTVDLGGGRLLLTDVVGNRFEVDRNALDARSRALVARVL